METSDDGTGMETGGQSREFSPLTEVPKNISLVQIPPVGRIRGRDVRIGMHDGPTRAMADFFSKIVGTDALSIEGRLLTSESQRELLTSDSLFQFQALSRVKLVTSGEEVKGYIMHPRFDSAGKLINEAQVVANLSQPFTPSTLAPELGYDVGFVQLNTVIAALSGRIEPPESYMVKACNEFRLGSDTLPQSELDQIARNLGIYMFNDEIRRERESTINWRQSQAQFRYLPLTSTYLAT